MRIAAYASVGVMALGLFGCSSSTAPPPFAGGGEVSNAVAYPPGPYGTGVGSQIENFDWVGYVDGKNDHASMQLIQLADFYNPHAFDQDYDPASPDVDDRLFPPGSQYGAGLPKPTVLALDIASVWCGPCNEEAADVLPVLSKRYAACGGTFLLQLADGPDQGVPATPQNLVEWDEEYKITYPTAVDPEYKTEIIWAAEAFPENISVDLTTMTIIDRIAGVPPTQICADNTALCNTDPSFGASQPCASGAECIKYSYWQNYEAHLDKSRTGCDIK